MKKFILFTMFIFAAANLSANKNSFVVGFDISDTVKKSDLKTKSDFYTIALDTFKKTFEKDEVEGSSIVPGKDLTMTIKTNLDRDAVEEKIKKLNFFGIKYDTIVVGSVFKKHRKTSVYIPSVK